MQELTYILGAGASFQSIPLVKTFPNRFHEFVEIFNPKRSKSGLIGQAAVHLKSIYPEFLRLAKTFKSHQSFDTYFKKLYHTKQDDEIKLSKKLLHLYFLWEHLVELNDELDNKAITNDFKKEARIDKRYDALIAGLLNHEKDNANLYCKLNFITWNYDLNLLCSIKNYYAPHKSFGDFMDAIKTPNQNVWQISNRLSIVNMNGYFYSGFFNEIDNLEITTFDSIVYQKLNPLYFDNKTEDLDSSLIKFSWENSLDATIEIAAKKIESSNSIIIIGYTFPLYNRPVDLRYLSQGELVKKQVLIQDPNAEKLKQDFIDFYQLNNYEEIKNKITGIENCDSFYVPSNIFGIKEFQYEISVY